ncbi:MAG: glycosyltransferase [Deltaproteobacteria bacterium]|nr:glycosyltransferase [Deltaproteobacteria bacterium]
MNPIKNRLSLSVVIPVYSGAQFLEKLVGELNAIRIKWADENAVIALTEAIFIVDEAIDRSAEILDEQAGVYSWITVLHLSRNFGQHPATTAGILQTSGDWVITLDEDMQHPPSKIEAMLHKAAINGIDVVYACPEQAVHESIFRDYSSRIYKKIIGYLAGNENIQLFNSFRLIRGSIARAASGVCGHDTYFDVALSWFSQRIGTVEMALKDDRVIQSGKSGYDLQKLFSHARRMIVSTHMKALRIGAVLGAIGLISSFAYGGYVLSEGLFSHMNSGARGWSSLMIVVLFFGGVSTFMSGVLLEYIAVILLHTQGKPAFFIVDRRSDALLLEWLRSERTT